MDKNKDITPRNNKGEPHGLWERYYSHSDNLRFKCLYHNGKEIGYEEFYNISNGESNKKKYYL